MWYFKSTLGFLFFGGIIAKMKAVFIILIILLVLFLILATLLKAPVKVWKPFTSLLKAPIKVWKKRKSKNKKMKAKLKELEKNDTYDAKGF